MIWIALSVAAMSPRLQGLGRRQVMTKMRCTALRATFEDARSEAGPLERTVQRILDGSRRSCSGDSPFNASMDLDTVSPNILFMSTAWSISRRAITSLLPGRRSTIEVRLLHAFARGRIGQCYKRRVGIEIPNAGGSNSTYCHPDYVCSYNACVGSPCS